MSTILLVDDDTMVQSVTEELLTMMGYEVIGAETGAAALDIVRTKADAIDLILLDLSLPDMNGADLLPQLLNIRPDLTVVLCSGSMYDESAVAELRDKGVKGMLQKPFDLNSLRETVEKILT